MKPQIYLLGMLLYSFLAVTSCKKGEEDPTFSFHTRDQRITGDWVLRSSLTTYSDSSVFQLITDDTSFGLAGQEEYSSYLKGEVLTIEDSYISDFDLHDNWKGKFKYEYHSKLSIRKDGTYSYSESYRPISSDRTYWIEDFDWNTWESNWRQVTEHYDYTEQESGTSLEELSGYWYWLENTKNKCMIGLDLLGVNYLLKLSNTEMKWEYRYGYTDKYTSESIIDKYIELGTSEMTWVKVN